jgi:hypothetical protein
MAKTDTEPKRPREVFTLVAEVGRKKGDGLPDGSTGAGLLCYAAARDEAEAVRETVAVLKTAGMAPLDITAYGTAEDRRQNGAEIGPEEQDLIQRALDENAVIVAEVTVFDGAGE